MIPHIGWFSALPPTRSGIADYSVELLTLLSGRCRITVFHAQPDAVDPALQRSFDIRPITSFPTAFWEIDLPVYQMGNHPGHQAALYPWLRTYPGLMVLHDVSLYDFLHHHDPERAVAWETDRTTAYRMRYYPDAADRLRLPLNRRLLALMLGVVVHSKYAAQRVRASSAAPVYPMPLLVQPEDVERADIGTHSAESRTVTFALVGHINRDKQLDVCLRCFGRIHADHPDTRFAIIGQPDNVDVPGLIAALPPAAQPHVVHHGYITERADFHRELANVDVVMGLRHPTQGETSAATLRALALGKPVIVYDQGWYAELPDDVALTVPVGDEAGVEAAMRQLLSDQLRATMSRSARRFVPTHHNPEAIADRFVAIIYEVLERYGR